MPKRPPYMEIILTLLVLAFLGLIVAGGFNQRSDDTGRVTLRPE